LIFKKNCTKAIPGKYDKKIEPVPGLRKVGLLADEAHRHDLRAHLEGEEREDEMIEPAQHLAA